MNMKSVRIFLLLASTLVVSAISVQPSRAQSLPPGPTPITPQPMEPAQQRPVGPSGREHFPGEPADVQPVLRKKPIDVVTARKEAHELVDMAGKVSGQMDLLSKNALPKGLVEQLKQIEKLAKNLRKQIEP
jgi:hypothetical protein